MEMISTSNGSSEIWLADGSKEGVKRGDAGFLAKSFSVCMIWEYRSVSSLFGRLL